MSPGDQLVQAIIGGIGDIFVSFFEMIFGVLVDAFLAPLAGQIAAALGLAGAS